MIEYALLVALIAIIALAAVQLPGQQRFEAVLKCFIADQVLILLYMEERAWRR